MKRLRLAVLGCAAIGFTGWAMAQNPGSGLSEIGQNPMPGEIVGSGISLHQVGKDLPKAGKPVGQPVNLPTDNPLLRRYDPNKPYDVFKGTNLDVSSVVGPMNGASVVTGTNDPNALARLYDKMKSFVGLSTKPTITRIYTPGIVRRDKQRFEARAFRRD